MRSRIRLLPVVASLACALLLSAAPAALAQEASPAASPSPFCAVLTPEEIGATLGVDVTVSDSTDINCTYQADFASGVFLLVDARYQPDDTLEDFKTFFADYADVTVAGQPAILAPDATLLFVGVDGGLFTVQVVGSPAKGIDPAAAIQALGAAAVPRLAAIPLPTPEPEATDFPLPSFVGDPELAALFPTTLGGKPLELQSFSGAEIQSFGDPDAMVQVEDALTSAGKTFDDLSLAYAYNTQGGITAIRIRGMDIASALDQFLPLLLANMDEPVQTPTEIAGKPVIEVTDAQNADTPTTYLYPKGEVIWQVTAKEPVLSEAFTALP